MRIRSALAFALVVPLALSAQVRRPRIGNTPPGVEGTLEGGRQPEVIARSQAIVRSRLSVETYPMFGHISAPNLVNNRPVSSYNTFGQGTHLDYSTTSWLSATLDLTASVFGGPGTTETIETGFRIKSPQSESRLRPFVDVRFGFANSSDRYTTSSALGIGPASQIATDSRYSRGFGGIAGIGTDVGLTSSWALMTEVSAMRSNMATYRYDYASIPQAGEHYLMTSYRLALGIRYNRARSVEMRSPSLR